MHHFASWLICGLIVSCLSADALAENITFPADAGVIDVTKEPFNAKGDGKTDDTAAIKLALERTGLIYFPNGTYLLSQPLAPPKRKGKVPSRRILQGQSRDGTVIKIADNATPFADPANPAALFTISHKPEQAFRNGVRNLTIDTGRGNPGAIGLRYYASNQGGMHFVTIRSGDGKGKIGLDLDYSSGNGPLLINDIKVRGFDMGINGGGGHLCTFENVDVEGQNVVGFRTKNYAFVRGFRSKQTTASAVKTDGNAMLSLIDASCEGTGPAALVIDGAGAFVRNLTTTGYDAAIRRGDQHTPGPAVAEWTSAPPLSHNGKPAGDGNASIRSLNLPIKPVPEVPWDDPATWASVMAFEPKMVEVKNSSGKGRHYFDVTEAFQKAIDSGATTVYFPRRRAEKDAEEYHLLGTVHVRGNVRRIIGMESEFRSFSNDKMTGDETDKQLATGSRGKIVIDDGAAPVVVIERFDTIYGHVLIEHKAKRTLVLSSLVTSGMTIAPDAGDVFIEDVVLAFLDINGGNVWARQLNMENGISAAEASPRPNARNNGGTLWIHGLKTEHNRTKVHTVNGRTEVSAFILANRSSNPLPMFVNEDSAFSLTLREDVLRDAPFQVLVRNIHGGKTVDLTREHTAKVGQGSMIPLYVAKPK